MSSIIYFNLLYGVTHIVCALISFFKEKSTIVINFGGVLTIPGNFLFAFRCVICNNIY